MANTIEQRVLNLENMMKALSNKIDNLSHYDTADKTGIRKTEGIHTVGISENDTAICDVADLSDVNSQAIDDLAELVDELSNKVAEMEG